MKRIALLVSISAAAALGVPKPKAEGKPKVDYIAIDIAGIDRLRDGCARGDAKQCEALAYHLQHPGPNHDAAGARAAHLSALAINQPLCASGNIDACMSVFSDCDGLGDTICREGAFAHARELSEEQCASAGAAGAAAAGACLLRGEFADQAKPKSGRRWRKLAIEKLSKQCTEGSDAEACLGGAYWAKQLKDTRADALKKTGLALLNSQCAAGAGTACKDLAYNDDTPAADKPRLEREACEKGYGLACRGAANDAEQRDEKLKLLDLGCTNGKWTCEDAKNLRESPYEVRHSSTAKELPANRLGPGFQKTRWNMSRRQVLSLYPAAAPLWTKTGTAPCVDQSDDCGLSLPMVLAGLSAIVVFNFKSDQLWLVQVVFPVVDGSQKLLATFEQVAHAMADKYGLPFASREFWKQPPSDAARAAMPAALDKGDLIGLDVRWFDGANTIWLDTESKEGHVFVEIQYISGTPSKKVDSGL